MTPKTEPPDNMSEAEYRWEIIQQHRRQSILLETLTVSVAQNTEVVKRLDKSVSQAGKVPLALVIVGTASWFFWQGKVHQTVWLAMFLIAIFPWFGEAIRPVLTLFGKSYPSENKVAAAKALALGAIFAIGVMG